MDNKYKNFNKVFNNDANFNGQINDAIKYLI